LSKYNDPSFIFNIQTALQKFGYGMDLSGKWDDATKKTIEAFSIISVRRIMTELWMPKHGQYCRL
jgi:N-acetyl-anhydromuramyl-L-alanine amidase AmpD